MENLFVKKVPLYFETEESQLILGDSFKILTKMEPESVDMIFADPPYFLSNSFLEFYVKISYSFSLQKMGNPVSKPESPKQLPHSTQKPALWILRHLTQSCEISSIL